MRGGRALRRLVEWLRRHAETDRHSVTVTIAPAEAGRIFQMEIPRWALRLAGGVLAASLVLVVAGGVLYGFLIHDSLRLREVRKENAILHERTARLDAIERELAQLDLVRQKLYSLAGVGEASATQAAPRATPDPTAAPVPPSQEQEAMADSLTTPPGRSATPLCVVPVWGPMSQSFHGETAGGLAHPGVDIAGKEGTPILAAADGIVSFAGWDADLGNLLVLDHDGGWRTRYGHAQKIIVETGERVTAGQRVALLGSTGRSSAPHLHFELLNEGAPIDPALALPMGPRKPAVLADPGSQGQGEGE